MEKTDNKQMMTYEAYTNVVVLPPPPYRHAEEHRCSHKYTVFKRAAILFTSFLSIILSIGLTIMTIFSYESELHHSSADYNTLSSPKIMLARRSGGPFVEKGYFWIVVAIAIVLFILISICATYWCCRGSFENPLCFPCYALACCGIIQCAEVCCAGAIGGAAMADS
ncbi:hypothetical protein CONCODRAFT_77081 [Conidiobolus coronatus NRRL 28638]|uniref:Uncharacterized protein n=1 Tax=Conidiobolus coronatus (strain ATCC 28846 / CBS 209.66 / NRRL 28638) TaxID=796925 RepID=A0A137PG62_CONC2|nr:hypothetical protein CONCODRAFT_77081 [Conidiobolus coronatus NRRL 28638]|eukprot:KXN73931.1 hypothetical protein CONCODRAFT_77081 [Conidiobolus coronatus NRRL 28638]